ncbi:MAG: hypothetical protein K9M12_00960 [Candidatus Pacebacteria bacterium]|nr:hypothetical protein [Candidatus Paceibacterota bacterium]
MFCSHFGDLRLPAGNRSTDGSSFNNLNVNTNWWSSSQSSSTNSWRRNLNRDYSDVNRNTNNKLNGFSLRCVRDLLPLQENLLQRFFINNKCNNNFLYSQKNTNN